MSMLALLQDAYVRDGFGTREFFNQTTVHPVGLAVLLALSMATLFVARRHVALPLLVIACIVPQGQRIVIANADFTFIRILIIVAGARIALLSEWRSIVPTALDKIVVAWVLMGALGNVIQVATFPGVIYRAGLALDMLGVYFLCRVSFKNWRELDTGITCIALMACFSFFYFMFEKLTSRNLFSVMGGVSPFTGMREGKLRAQGPFVHPILAGCYWAVLAPLVMTKMHRSTRGERWIGILGFTAMVSIVFFTASSTPMIALGTNIMAIWAFRHRHRMRSLRWLMFCGAIFVHFYREKPIWHLIARVDVVGGSTGYHRYRLINAAVENFHEWWICGVKSTAHWGHYLFDVTNQYILEGVNAGLPALLAFLWMLIYCFKQVGETLPSVWNNRFLCRLSWAQGTSIFSQMAVFLAVSITHSGPSLLALMFVVASISSMTPTPEGAAVPARRELEPGGSLSLGPAGLARG